jgi:hypothetical protein
MIPAISPDVFRVQQHKRAKWVVSVAIYGASACLASAALGALLGALGPHARQLLSLRAAAIVLAVPAALYAASLLGLVRVPHLRLRRQAPSGWRTLHPWRSALRYGAYLGLGLLHFNTAPIFTLALLWTLLTVPDPATGAMVLVLFGLGQTLPIMLVARNVDSPAGAYAKAMKVEGLQGFVQASNGVCLAIAAGVAALCAFAA